MRESATVRPPEAAPPPVKLLRAILVLSCAVTGLSGLVGGYWLGLHCRSAVEPKPAPVAPAPVSKEAPAPEPTVRAEPSLPPALDSKASPEPIIPPSPEPATPPSPPVAPVTEPPVEAPPDPVADPEPEPLKVIPAPEAALKAFLSAPDWQSRAKHVLHADRLLAKMESYHQDMLDGPTVATAIKTDATGNPQKSERLFTYLVATEQAPAGFPVSITQTDGGWKVDWETFIEFRDDHFRRFATGEGSGDGGNFHLILRNTHYFGKAFPGSDKLTAFRVDPPLPERTQYAFVTTGSDLHKALATQIDWGRPCTPVLQLVRKRHPDGTLHLEIDTVIAMDWLPRG